MPDENTWKTQGFSVCSFSFTNLFSAGNAITKYRTPSSFCLFLTWDYPLTKTTVINCQTTAGQVGPGPPAGKGSFSSTFERVTHSLGGFSSTHQTPTFTLPPFMLLEIRHGCWDLAVLWVTKPSGPADLCKGGGWRFTERAEKVHVLLPMGTWAGSQGVKCPSKEPFLKCISWKLWLWKRIMS